MIANAQEVYFVTGPTSALRVYSPEAYSSSVIASTGQFSSAASQQPV